MDLSNWEKTDEIKRRRQISDLLLNLSIEQGHRCTFDLPSLDFEEVDTAEEEEQNIQDQLLSYINILKKEQSDFTLGKPSKLKSGEI